MIKRLKFKKGRAYKLKESHFCEGNEEIIDATYLGYSKCNHIFSRGIEGRKEYFILEDNWAEKKNGVVSYCPIAPCGYSSITKEQIKKQPPELKSQLLKMLEEVGDNI